MKFRQKNTFVTSLPNHGFKHGNLIGKIILTLVYCCLIAHSESNPHQIISIVINPRIRQHHGFSIRDTWHWFICVRRICHRLWLITEARNVAPGFLFRRHCGYVGIQTANSLFFLQANHLMKFLQRRGHDPLAERKQFRTFSDFSYTFLGFSPKFQGIFPYMYISQERLDE
jgi:hypothetical protein